MFHADRWAGAFFAVSGENADAVFLCLKALTPAVKSARGAFFGHNASAKLETALRGCSLLGSGVTDETAIRFLCLLVEKKCFRYIDLLMARIEQALNEKKGILDAQIESATALDSGLEKELAKSIKEKTGASDVNIKTKITPELLAGFKLRIGNFYIDASLKGQLENMAASLVGGF